MNKNAHKVRRISHATNLTESTYSCPLNTNTCSGFISWEALEMFPCLVGFQKDEVSSRRVRACMECRRTATSCVKQGSVVDVMRRSTAAEFGTYPIRI